MRIQTKLTAFFMIVLIAFSYALLWVSMQAYQEEVYRLNSEVSDNRLQEIYKIVSKEYELFLKNPNQDISKAKKNTIKQLKNNLPYPTDSTYRFPLIISRTGKFILSPKNYRISKFPWNSLSLDEIFVFDDAEFEFMLAEENGTPQSEMPENEDKKAIFKAKTIYSSINGDERVLLYVPFKRPDWNWLLCYSYPVNTQLYGIDTQWYSRQLLLIIACMVVAVAILFWLIQIFLSPLNRLVLTATNMAAGIFPKSTEKFKYSNDEIGFLSKAFDKMSGKIQQSMNKLQLEIKERREKEKEIRELMENTPLPIMIVHKNGECSTNNMFARIFGYSENELETFENWFELSTPPNISFEENRKIWEEILTRKTSGSKLVFIRCKDDRILEVAIRHKQVERQNLLIFSDLTKIKEAEKRLRTTRDYLNQLFNSIHLLLVAVDEDGRITQWNSAIEKFTGIKSESAIGVKLWNVALFLLNYQEEVTEAINSGVSCEKYRENISWRKGSYVFDISINPLRLKDNKGAVIILEDTTELARKNEILFQTQKMETVGTLTGGLAHDFNNVLGGIKGSLSMIKYYLNESPDEIEEMNDFLALAEKSVSRAASMVEQLLALSRKSQLSLKKFDLAKAFDHVLKICKGTFAKSVNLKFTKPDGKIMVKADQTQIEQVLLNLLINAEHAMTVMRDVDSLRGGDINIEITSTKLDKAQFPDVSSSDYYWEILIKDSGVGIKPENMPKIFDPFFTTKIKSKGTGLGLAMVYNIIDLHKGYVDVYSEPNKGSTFSIYLPKLQAEDEELEATYSTQNLYLGSGWILIIDDELVIRKTTTKMLELLGYNVLSAKNGKIGVEVFKEHQKEIRAVILDMAMPVMTGDEAYKHLKKLDPQVKVLMATGFTNDERVRKTLDAGANSFMKKPYSINLLSRKLHELFNS